MQEERKPEIFESYYEDESEIGYEKLKGFTKHFFIALALALALFQIYTATFGLLPSIQHRSVHLALASAIIFLVTPAVKGGTIKWYDVVFALLALFSAGHVALKADYIVSRFSYVTPLSPLEFFFGIVGVLLLLEASRRVMGWLLPIVAGIFLLYVFLGPYLPRALSHKGYTLMWTVDHLYYTPSGVFGVPLGVSSTYVAIFVIFGTLLAVSGGGKFMTDFAMSLMGGFRGGAAKVAILGSAFVGMIQGAASGNVVTTGSVSIPLMRRLGYDKHFASAVEATASTGGEITPPVMGAAAFIMAQMANIPYATIAKSAIIPAFLFYVGVYVAVDLRTIRLHLKGLPRERLPRLWQVLKEGFLFAIPVLIVLYMIFVGYTPIKAGVYAFFATYLASCAKKSTRLSWKQLSDSFIKASCNLAPVAVACAIAGVITGVITLTGVGLKFTQLIITVSAGNMFVALVLAMVVAIILGMGMPPSAAYILEAVLVAPALVDMGLTPLAAHLFVFYYTVMSAITPPVAVSAFAAAAISGSNPIKVGWIAVRLGLPGLLVPFAFVYGPELLLQGAFNFHSVVTIVTAVLGVVALCIGSEGYLVRSLNYLMCAVFIVAAIMLIVPNTLVSALGFCIFIAAVLFEVKHKEDKKNIDVKDAQTA